LPLQSPGHVFSEQSKPPKPGLHQQDPLMHAPLLLQLRKHCEMAHDSPPHSGAHTHVPLSQ
jgi:hypothetical protein